MTENWDSVNGLIGGIQAILSKHRSSFTDEDVKLLNACIERLKESENGDDSSLPPPDIIADSIFLILKVFTLIEEINKLQF